MCFENHFISHFQGCLQRKIFGRCHVIFLFTVLWQREIKYVTDIIALINFIDIIEFESLTII